MTDPMKLQSSNLGPEGELLITMYTNSSEGTEPFHLMKTQLTSICASTLTIATFKEPYPLTDSLGKCDTKTWEWFTYK